MPTWYTILVIDTLEIGIISSYDSSPSEYDTYSSVTEPPPGTDGGPLGDQVGIPTGILDTKESEVYLYPSFK